MSYGHIPSIGLKLIFLEVCCFFTENVGERRMFIRQGACIRRNMVC